MSTDPRPKQRGNEIGPTGLEVAKNIKRIRLYAGRTQADVSQMLAELGRPVPVASIGKIESGDRRVEVDDLIAFAVVLGVTPLALLMPHTRSSNETVNITGHRGPAFEAWHWAVGEAPLNLSSDYEDAESDVGVFVHASLPWWVRVQTAERSGELTKRFGERAFEDEADRATEVGE
ncbi:helix-turn-helix domain-containing protein [Rathayibacter sp. AY1C5]|uniref:helix-turn-helix domain-containing protein n=1 Tax=Rathayibacter sp. AY1C5 TaxID=2080538 RepID=UPI000CE7642E|nr:helix-turn-helix transcriptional regulator [Rathayibacter sp. AY1C5]PPG61629.1 XRE family transcriptional regulator [Rathayibacter sp. AY1C5]